MVDWVVLRIVTSSTWAIPLNFVLIVRCFFKFKMNFTLFVFESLYIYIIYGNELTSVVLPSSIEEISKDSFGNNPNLKQITLLNPNTVSYDGQKITDG